MLGKDDDIEFCRSNLIIVSFFFRIRIFSIFILFVSRDPGKQPNLQNRLSNSFRSTGVHEVDCVATLPGETNRLLGNDVVAFRGS